MDNFFKMVSDSFTKNTVIREFFEKRGKNFIGTCYQVTDESGKHFVMLTDVFDHNLTVDANSFIYEMFYNTISVKPNSHVTNGTFTLYGCPYGINTTELFKCERIEKEKFISEYHKCIDMFTEKLEIIGCYQ